jgi:hypothetical protein
MSGSTDRRSSIEQQLLEQPRRAAGIDARGEPVRLGEFDSHCHLVGYIDQHGLAWESLTERIIAVHGHRLAEAIALPYNDPRRDHVMDDVLDVPEDLVTEVAQEAAWHLWLNGQRRGTRWPAISRSSTSTRWETRRPGFAPTSHGTTRR